MEKPNELKSDAEVQQIKAEISDTQAELQQTVAEIQDRLSPSHLKDQATTTMREATIGKVEHMMNGNNPIPYALIGIGAAWLLASRSSQRGWNGYRNGESTWGGRAEFGSRDYGANEDRFTSTSHASQSKTAEWQAAASDRAAEVTERARRAAYRTRNRWNSMLDENPVVLGIAALAAGALVGASLPQTEVENEYLGETRDQMLDSAKEMAKDMVDKVAGTDQPT